MNIVRCVSAFVGAALLFSGSAHAQTVTTTTRHYDCTKAGNANKAACKGAAAAAAPAAAPAAVTKTTTRNYDCSKAGNANKAVCKSAAKAPAAPAAPAATPAAASETRTTATHTMTTSKTTATNSAGPNGATAQCKDGTYSHSAHRSGTCAGHKGVATWY